MFTVLTPMLIGALIYGIVDVSNELIYLMILMITVSCVCEPYNKFAFALSFLSLYLALLDLSFDEVAYRVGDSLQYVVCFVLASKLGSAIKNSRYQVRHSNLFVHQVLIVIAGQLCWIVYFAILTRAYNSNSLIEKLSETSKHILAVDIPVIVAHVLLFNKAVYSYVTAREE